MFKVLISDAMSNVAEQIFEEKNISVDVITGLSEVRFNDTGFRCAKDNN